MLVAAFYNIVDKLPVAERLFQIGINLSKVTVKNFCDIIELTAKSAGLLCLLCSGGVSCVLHINSSALVQSYMPCLLCLNLLDLYKCGFFFVL